ncbi:hypothetical protein Salat_0269600 [Sesamum alatum]|uniref:Uncharacterized protein n=1 Tax=Sesamum alatum TaxID=300844 RepID=A0AAE1YZY8_9LAMI|nr:hypothetical protein Salat_0269600 [Sesamum alatum]
MVAWNWSFPTASVGMLRLSDILRRLKQMLKHWNLTVFGDIFASLKQEEESMAAAEPYFDADPTIANLTDLNRRANGCSRGTETPGWLTLWFRRNAPGLLLP